MSLAELLPAIRALPRAEQVELLHLLIDGVSQAPPPQPTADGIPDELRKLLPPPGSSVDVWFPEANPAAVAAAQQALQEFGDRSE